MAASKTKLGRIPCDGCGHPTVVKESEIGTLTMVCDECDMSAFGKKGTACAARWRAKLPALPKAAAEPAPEPAPSSKDGGGKAPAAPVKANAFDSLFGFKGK